MSHYACEALERTGGALYASVTRKQAKVKTFANFRQAPLEVVARACGTSFCRPDGQCETCCRIGACGVQKRME